MNAPPLFLPAASEVEEAFRAALLDSDMPVPAGLSDGAGQPAGRRYAVYRNNVAVALGEALESGFPAVAGLLGPQNFRMVAGIYLRRHPPTSPVMPLYGAGFAAFLETAEALARWPYLGDVARLEYALRQAYHAADAEPLSPEALTSLATGDLPRTRLRLAPALQVVRSPYPVIDIRNRALGLGQSIGTRGQCALVTRPEFDPVADPLPQADAALLDRLMAGDTLGAALEETGTDPTPLLSLLIARRALTGLETTQ
ncbi:DNA-binding domain-containing protein [Pseudooceanicola nanhaiensis]|uniref:HvfC/BufC N-terminal domain-containing protein n=1 Tax=Pseudooceanicola nanhaiensis TaxID=375761 RepID=UPI001CD489E0|nr:DNA-binding domain-containing protein [Pseudooceanicola nanhaiensis]MCA0922428.1 DNA-binding domain-containing protein [Pseudooceanicola nanhaiensis]